MGCCDEVGDDFVHAGAVECGGERVGLVEADCGGGDRLPAAFGGGHGAGWLPWDGHAGFAASVGELDAGVGAVIVQEGGDALELGDVVVFPDTEVGGGDAAFGVYRCGLCDDEAGATNGAVSEVHEMPFVGESVDAG